MLHMDRLPIQSYSATLTLIVIAHELFTRQTEAQAVVQRQTGEHWL
jgi:hypothetical protein